jgi:hypothetical protein
MTTARITRRRFLTAMGVGGAAAAAAVVGHQSGERRERGPKVGKHGAGYQLTEHVRKYYESAKV